MFLRRFSPEKSSGIPPMTMVATGLVLIACAFIWPRVTALQGGMSSGGVDFIQGFLIGIGIACEILGIAGMFGGKKKDDSSSIIPRR